MPANRDVGLATALVEQRQERTAEVREGLGVIDDAPARRPHNAVDVGLVQRPRIEEGLNAVDSVVDRPFVEAQHLGPAEHPPTCEPGRPCTLKALLAGSLEERSHGAIQRLGEIGACGVGLPGEVTVSREHGGSQRVLGSSLLGAPYRNRSDSQHGQEQGHDHACLVPSS